MLYYIFASPQAAELGLTDYRAFPYVAACTKFPSDNKQ